MDQLTDNSHRVLIAIADERELPEYVNQLDLQVRGSKPA